MYAKTGTVMDALSTITSNTKLARPKINSWRFDFPIFMHFKYDLNYIDCSVIFRTHYVCRPLVSFLLLYMRITKIDNIDDKPSNFI
jgi:hypothetical protein